LSQLPAKELDGIEQALAGTPQVARYSGYAVVAAACLLAGSKAGQNAGQVGAVAGGAVATAAAAAGIKAAEDKRKGVAAKEVYNLFVGGNDPEIVRREQVDAVGAKYDVNLPQTFGDELKQIYDFYVTSVMPEGDRPLVGDEGDKIAAFREALGIEDRDAADVHLEIGRRIFRKRFELASKTAELEQRREFQKLIFVSQQVFGDAKARFLLPWKRVFNITDAQVSVAIRENANMLYRNKLKGLGLEPDREKLTVLREYQVRLGLADDVAAESLKDMMRKQAEAYVSTALEDAKQRTRAKDNTRSVATLRQLLDYSSKFVQLMGDSSLAVGLGPASLHGGDFDQDSRRGDLKLLYTVFLESCLEDGELQEMEESELEQLKVILGLGNKEAEKIRLDTTTKAYRNQLRHAVTSKELDAAPSKAAWLQTLCQKLRFPPETAAQVHQDIFRQRLASSLEGEKLSEEDKETLNRLRILLCIPENVVNECMKEIAGKIYQDTIVEAMSVGIDAFSKRQRDMVRQKRADIGLPEDIAFEILNDTTRKLFLGFITRSRNMPNRLEAAKELKKLVFFSNIVVAPLVQDLKPGEVEDPTANIDMQTVDSTDSEAAAKAQDELDQIMEEAKNLTAEEEAAAEEEEGDVQPRTLQKTQTAAESVKTGEVVGEGSEAMVMKSQKDITIANELERRDRLDIYRNFLLYCMTGDVVQLPMGSNIVVERDQSEFLRLSQLGDILGLTQFDVAEVHQGLAEQAFRNQVQNTLGDGKLTKERSESLKKLQQDMGLSDEMASRIIQGVTNQRMMKDVDAQIAGGRLSLDEIRSMKEGGMDVEALVGENIRIDVYRKEVEGLMTSGKGEFDESEVYGTIRETLGIGETKAKDIVTTIAQVRKRNSLVQAVSYLRQKNKEEVIKSLNNMIVCDKAVPDLKISWNKEEELMDLYSVYLLGDQPEERRRELQNLLKLSDETVKQLTDVVQSGGFAFDEESQEEALF